MSRKCNISRIAHRDGEAAARRALAETIARCEGKLMHTAAAENIHRSHVYRLVHDLRLWPVVNHARQHRLEQEKARRCTETLVLAS